MTTTGYVGSFSVNSLDDDIGTYLFLAEHTRRGHAHLVERDLDRHVEDSVLPDNAVVLRTIDAGPRRDLLADVDGVAVLLRVWRQDAEIWASADTADAARAVADAVKARVGPRGDDHSVEVRFSDGTTTSRSVVLAVRPWAEITGLYPAPVRTALATLMTHQPDLTEARRLLVWYGVPGTGKTTAVRALLHAWREWCDPVVVTDPERLLSDGRYLRRLIFNLDDERWRILVLEDAESLLRKGGAGPAMGRLLNLTDGLLGQGLRCLFLVTTNEPLDVLHPALARPGRCLARVEFGPLEGDRTLAEVLAERAITVTAAQGTGAYL